MSDAAKLASAMLATKAEGISYQQFVPKQEQLLEISEKINEAVTESAYSASISFVEAIGGLTKGEISWAIVRLYYSCFYSIRGLLLLGGFVPFTRKGEYILDVGQGGFIKGGNSSHTWSWSSFRKLTPITSDWWVSQDSEDAYTKLRGIRESVNYINCFTDPEYHKCLVSEESDLGRRFRSYRDDISFSYTYLDDHFAIAYPTKLLFEFERKFREKSLALSESQMSHIKRIWKIKDRCPMT